MELLLNLLWLMLALGALLICWSVPISSGKASDDDRLRVSAIAGCLLALAFPVISASDDLNALRTEMEESCSIHPGVKKATNSRSPTWSNDVPSPAEAVQGGLFRPEREPREQVSEYLCAFSEQGLAKIMGCRAPPCPKSSISVAPSTTARFFNLDSMLQIPQVSTMGLQQHRLPQASAAPPHGLRDFKCEISLLTASSRFRRIPRDMARILCQPAHDPTCQSLQKQKT